MLTKRAQNLSLSTIIIALLVLLVFVILAFIFTQKIGGFNSSFDACSGICQAGAQCGNGEIGIKKDRCYAAGNDVNGDGNVNAQDHVQGQEYCCVND